MNLKITRNDDNLEKKKKKNTGNNLRICSVIPPPNLLLGGNVTAIAAVGPALKYRTGNAAQNNVFLALFSPLHLLFFRFLYKKTNIWNAEFSVSFSTKNKYLEC